jgi:hypothetical protein
MYVDGSPDGSTSTGAAPINYGTTAYLTVGIENTNDSYFDGSIDDVRFYSRKLDATEIQALYIAGAGPSPTASHWRARYDTFLRALRRCDSRASMLRH